jgi:hypothetical protein
MVVVAVQSLPWAAPHEDFVLGRTRRRVADATVHVPGHELTRLTGSGTTPATVSGLCLG